MNKYAKYEIRPSEFRPVNYDNVRWLNQDDFCYMNEFCSMSLETWNGAKEAGYTYCAVIEEGKTISIAAVWKYSPDKWEAAAVNTRKGYENMGFAKQVVSFVTDYILSQNKIPTLTTGENNIPMTRAAEKLGFKLIEIREKPY